MNLRIISGKFGGRTISAPDGSGLTHPMSERVRGSLFNMINTRLDGADVLDVFAGSGSLGLESLSRGAKSAIFVERDRVASKILLENISKLKVDAMAESVQIGVSTWIDKNSDKRFDFIFADPPYNDLQFAAIKKLGALLKPDGMMVLSYPQRTVLPDFDGLTKVDDRNYGTANLAFYSKK